MMAELTQTDCDVVGTTEFKTKVANGFMVIVHVKDGVPQLPPVVVTA